MSVAITVIADAAVDSATTFRVQINGREVAKGLDADEVRAVFEGSLQRIVRTKMSVRSASSDKSETQSSPVIPERESEQIAFSLPTSELDAQIATFAQAATAAVQTQLIIETKLAEALASKTKKEAA
jgi:hypothetical protein